MQSPGYLRGVYVVLASLRLWSCVVDSVFCRLSCRFSGRVSRLSWCVPCCFSGRVSCLACCVGWPEVERGRSKDGAGVGEELRPLLLLRGRLRGWLRSGDGEREWVVVEGKGGLKQGGWAGGRDDFGGGLYPEDDVERAPVVMTMPCGWLA
jgi:hypothetical protein